MKKQGPKFVENASMECCPFCGKYKTKQEATASPPYEYRVVCFAKGCRATGPVRRSARGAIKEWNQE